MEFVTKDASLTILLTMSLVILITQLEDGDIICFQRSLTSEEDIHRYPDVPSYLEYVHNRQVHNLLVASYYFTLAFPWISLLLLNMFAVSSNCCEIIIKKMKV